MSRRRGIIVAPPADGWIGEEEAVIAKFGKTEMPDRIADGSDLLPVLQNKAKEYLSSGKVTRNFSVVVWHQGEPIELVVKIKTSIEVTYQRLNKKRNL
jgi:hypothetical protein